MDLFTGITSILGGGITGLIGSVTQRVYEYKTKKLEIELQRDKYANDIAIKKMDADMQMAAWTAKIDIQDSQAFNSALSSEPKVYHEANLTPAQNWLMVLLDGFKGAIRPGLTLYLCAITTVIYIRAARLINANIILPSMAYDILVQIVNTILYLTTTCILFWFGTRNKAKQK